MRLLAAEFGELLPLIVGAIALVSWIANKLRERAVGGGEVADVPAADDGGHVQAEIDRFLQEVRGAGGQPGRANVVASEDAFETPAEPARQRRSRPQPDREPARLVDRPRLADRHVIGDRTIDTDVDEGVLEHLPAERMGRLVDRDLGHGVESSVASHLGSADGTEVETAMIWEDGALTAESLIGLLTRPDGVRQAVVVQEILSRPKGRRGRTGL